MYQIVHTLSVGRIYPFLLDRSTERNTEHDALIFIINIFYNSLKEINPIQFLWAFVLTFKSNSCCLKKSLQMRQRQKLLIQNAPYYGNVWLPFWDCFRGIRHTRLEGKKRVFKLHLQQSQPRAAMWFRNAPRASHPHPTHTTPQNPMRCWNCIRKQNQNYQIAQRKGRRGSKCVTRSLKWQWVCLGKFRDQDMRLSCWTSVSAAIIAHRILLSCSVQSPLIFDRVLL